MKPFALLLVALACGATWLRAADATLPGDGYDASRYEDLWKKSPFAVATSEAAPDSPDFMLVGIATVDGVNYASVIDKKTQEHYLVSSDHPSDGLTLTSITPGHDGNQTFAVMQRDGQALTLKLESAPTGPGGAPMPGTGMGVIPTMNPGPVPGAQPPTISIPMPGTPTATPGGFPGRPMIPRYRRPQIHLPPPPGSSSPAQSTAPPPTAPPQ